MNRSLSIWIISLKHRNRKQVSRGTWNHTVVLQLSNARSTENVCYASLKTHVSTVASHQRVPPLCLMILMFNSWYKDLFARWEVVEDFVLWNLEPVGLSPVPSKLVSSWREKYHKRTDHACATIKYYCKEGQPKKLETIQNKRLKKWNSFPRMAKEWYPKWQFGAMMSFPILNRGVACGRSLSKPATKTYIGSTRQLPSNLLH